MLHLMQCFLNSGNKFEGFPGKGSVKCIAKRDLSYTEGVTSGRVMHLNICGVLYCFCYWFCLLMDSLMHCDLRDLSDSTSSYILRSSVTVSEEGAGQPKPNYKGCYTNYTY